MNKLIKLLSIIAIATVAVSAFLLIVFIAFQGSITSIFGVGNIYVFTLPAAQIFYILSAVCLAVFTFLTAGNKKIGIWAEIIIFGYACLILPSVNRLIGLFQNLYFGKFGGSDLIASAASVSSICSVPVGIAAASISLIILVCGMSFAYKRLTK